MKLITSKGDIDLKDHFLISTSGYGVASQDPQNLKVIDRDGDITFTSGFRNKQIRLTLTHKKSTSLATRRYLMDQITPYFIAGGYAIFDFEAQKKWAFQLLRGTSINFSGTYDTAQVELDLKPCGVNSFNEEDLTWDTAAIAWDAAEMSWLGSQTTFTVSNESFTIENLGNYVSKPLIKVTTTGTVTLAIGGKSLIITGISGIIYVDNDRLIAYDDSLVNKISNTNGVFLELEPGDNLATITGSATLEFIDKSRWI